MEEYLPVTFDDLYRAYLDCIKRKKNKFDAKKFEQYAFYNLKILLDEINERRYRLKQAKCFIVNDPTIREVFCCSFRDRIVHHFVYNELNPVIEKMLIFDAASCRKGKGTDFAIKRVQRFIRTASNNYTDTAYYLKFDLSGFFMNIDRQRMLKLVLDVIHNRYEGRYKEVLDYLVRIIILTDITKGAKRVSPIEKWEKLPARKSLYGNPNGLPIGNLCSQIFANLYLNELDHIIKGRERFYSRYVDDAIIINSDRQYLINTLDVIRKYLGSIGLSLNMKKTYIQDAKYGILFLGIMIKPYYSVLGKSRINRMYKSSCNFNDVDFAYRSISSRKGMVHRYHGHKVYRRWFYSLDKEFTDKLIMDHSCRLHYKMK